MSEAAITESELQAYVDGRLDESRRLVVEGWLAGRPEEAERVQQLRRIAEELRASYQPVLLEPIPDRLTSAARSPRRRLVRYAAAAAWMATGIAVGTAAGWQIRGLQPARLSADAGSAMARRAAVAHAVYSPEVRHPVEVGADQEAHLIAWLSKRLGAPLRAPTLESTGYSLVGGRLLPGDNGPVAYLMYQSKQGRRITLYVRTEVTANRETAFRYAKEGNIQVFYWVDRKLGYALSSGDVNKEELLHVANVVYQQLNP